MLFDASVSTPFSGSPKLSRVFPAIAPWKYGKHVFYIFFFGKHRDKKKGDNLLTLIVKNVILFAPAIITSTAPATSVSPSSFGNTICNQSARVLS